MSGLRPLLQTSKVPRPALRASFSGVRSSYERMKNFADYFD